MFHFKHSFIKPGLIAYSLSGVFLTIVSTTPIQAKTPANPQKVAQLLPEPGFVPQYRNNQNYQNYSNSRIYTVFVDSSYGDNQLLERIRRIIPDAFRTTQAGSSVIQAGSFRDYYKADNIVRQLRSRGIYAYINNQNNRFGRKPDYPNYSNNNNPDYSRNNNYPQKTKYYYVVIPGKSKKLSQIENQIIQSVGTDLQYYKVNKRNSSRGSHIAIGPFTTRLEAEQWNNYFRSIKLDNSRVYYGK